MTNKQENKPRKTSPKLRSTTPSTALTGTEIVAPGSVLVVNQTESVNLVDRFSYAAKWYREANSYIQEHYEYPKLFASLLAATSPRMSIARNWRVANMIYRKWTTGQGLDLSQSMRTHHPNIRRAIRNEPLSGPKVSAFAANLMGDFERVTIDTWVLRYYGLSGSITGKRYAELADRIRREAREHGYKPAEWQAVIWTIIRKQYGKSYRSFLGVANAKQTVFGFMKNEN